VIDVDLLVVGAGPAGSAAALGALTADPEARVLLLDRATFPRDKVCGDGVGPEGVDVLDHLGVGDVLDGYEPLHRVRLIAPDGTVAAGEAPRPGVVVPREVLDARLHDAAIAAGAEPVTHRVREVDRVGDRVVVDGTYRARVVVGADGANGVTRRVVGAGDQPASHTGIAMRGYGHAPDLDELVIAFVPDRWPAYAWAFPIGDGTVNVGYGPFDRRTLTDGRAGLEASLDGYAELLGVEVEASTLRAHHLPLSTHRPAPAHGRVLLAGDAASLINPFTGEGIYYALLSGTMAGRAAIRFPERPGEAYASALRARLGRHLRHTTFAARLFHSTWPVNRSVDTAARNPDVLADLCEFALGTGLLTPRLVAGLTRAWIRG
jgi:geranylgeranyl reductase family protein